MGRGGIRKLRYTHCFCESCGKQGCRSAKDILPRLCPPVHKSPSVVCMCLISLTNSVLKIIPTQYLSHGSSGSRDSVQTPLSSPAPTSMPFIFNQPNPKSYTRLALWYTEVPWKFGSEKERRGHMAQSPHFMGKRKRKASTSHEVTGLADR